MSKPAQVTYIEPRWPVALTSIVVFALLAFLPSRIRLLPTWVPCLFVIALNVPMAALALTHAKARWLRIEGVVTLLFLVIVGLLNVAHLRYLFAAISSASGKITGLQLLTSSVTVWTVNVLVFSLAYWRIDRGGPETRTNQAGSNPDWLFPQESGDAPYHRRTMFLDYLFLAFWTAMAFSPTDAAPLSYRAKLLMLLESLISLVTLVIVAARAINILGS